MTRPRVELQTILETILGSRNVYFQPPENLKLKFPCIVYELDSIEKREADNAKYQLNNRYTLTYIDSDPESDVPYELLNLEYTSFDRAFVSDNLNHWVISIYF